MYRSTVLLLTDKSLEGRIIENFLQTAGYSVLNVYASTLTHAPEQASRADVAILALDEPQADLGELCKMLRDMAHAPNLPIVAVVSPREGNSAPRPANGVRVLLRPIRLFELARAVEQALQERPRDSANRAKANGQHKMEQARDSVLTLERRDSHARR